MPGRSALLRTVFALALAVPLGGPGLSAAQTTPPAASAPLGPDTCAPLRKTVADATDLASAALDSLLAYKQRFADLLAALEKEVEMASAEDRAARLAQTRELLERMSDLSTQEEEVQGELRRLAAARTDLDRLCPPSP